MTCGVQPGNVGCNYLTDRILKNIITFKIKLTILLLSFFVSALFFGQIKLEDLKDYTTITGFHYAADFHGMKVFTKNGLPDIQTINYKNLVFNAFVVKDRTLIFFTSGDLDERKYFDKFRKTFYSIKL